MSVNFKQITWQCFTLLNILIWIVRSILSTNSKHFRQNFYSNNLYIVDIINYSLKINQAPPFFPGILVLFWQVICKTVMFFLNVSYMVKISLFHIIMTIIIIIIIIIITNYDFYYVKSLLTLLLKLHDLFWIIWIFEGWKSKNNH